MLFWRHLSFHSSLLLRVPLCCLRPDTVLQCALLLAILLRRPQLSSPMHLVVHLSAATSLSVWATFELSAASFSELSRTSNSVLHLLLRLRRRLHCLFLTWLSRSLSSFLAVRYPTPPCQCSVPMHPTPLPSSRPPLPLQVSLPSPSCLTLKPPST